MKRIVLFIAGILCWTGGFAVVPGWDTPDVTAVDDTLPAVEQVIKKPHSPHKATIMAMLLPGSGQIYNGQWWKVPVLYGGIVSDMYGIIWNNKHYKLYRDAYVEWVQYLERLNENPDTPYPKNPAWDEIPKGFDVETAPYMQTSSGKEWFKNILNNRKTKFKRNRDLCYIVMAVVYAVNIIDATVYAHFYDFEIDDNLSFSIRPSSSYSPVCGGSIGLALTMRF